MKVSGWRKKLKNKSEMKYSVYTRSSTLATLNLVGITTLWSNNGVDAIANPYFPKPSPGVSEIQRIGQDINLLYAEVTITILMAETIPSTGQDFLRVMLIRARQNNQTVSAATDVLYVLDNASPIRNKDWSVQYDKTFTFNTGLSDNSTLSTDPTIVLSTQSKPKQLRFIIPLKQTIDCSDAITNLFPYNLYLAAYTYYNDNYFVYHVNTIYYYRDP